MDPLATIRTTRNPKYPNRTEPIPEMPRPNHHHRRKPSHSKKKISICDDFPKNIPPPDTDTTSYLCVDKNGCCNFTTVQSAVDAVGNFSQRRNVIWINSGMY